jgi:hypothetical protein
MSLLLLFGGEGPPQAFARSDSATLTEVSGVARGSENVATDQATMSDSVTSLERQVNDAFVFAELATELNEAANLIVTDAAMLNELALMSLEEGLSDLATLSEIAQVSIEEPHPELQIIRLRTIHPRSRNRRYMRGNTRWR